MTGQFEWLKTSPERLQQVVDEISLGAAPKACFYAMLTAAALLASFGLVANSGAIIIGAMLVCPLMTPILGIALGLVRADPQLLGRALRAELTGMVMAMSMATIFGLLPLALQATPEMLACARPNLLDLLVAVLAGFAGTYALIDARLSPALPGVAIATSIMPPLANTGLCLALGAYQGAWGSFLLFLANFLGILLVAAATFFAAGMAPEMHRPHKWELVHRFGVAALGFLLVAGLLTHALVRIIQERYLNHAIQEVITAEFSRFPATSLESAVPQRYHGKLYVLATVRTPKVFTPDRVKKIQDALSRKIGLPTELIVRVELAKDVSATGSTSQVTAQNLDGFFLGKHLEPDVLKVQEAEQVLREILADRPEIHLMEVDLLHFPRGPVILATLQGARVLIPAEVRAFEQAIRERLQAPNLLLLTRNQTTVDVDGEGHILSGSAHFGSLSPEELALQERADAAVQAELRKIPQVLVTDVDAVSQDDSWLVRVAAVGTRPPSPQEVQEAQKAVSRRLQKPTKIYLWFQEKVMITAQGYASVQEFTRKRLANNAEGTQGRQPPGLAEME